MLNNNVISQKYIKAFNEKYLDSTRIRNDFRKINKGRALDNTFVKFSKNSNINNAKEICLDETSTWITNSYKNAFHLANELYDILSKTTNASFSYSASVILNKEHYLDKCNFFQTLSSTAVFLRPYSYGLTEIDDAKIFDEFFNDNIDYIVNIPAFMEALEEFGLNIKIYTEDLVRFERIKVDNFYDLDENVIKGNTVVFEVTNKKNTRVRK